VVRQRELQGFPSEKGWFFRGKGVRARRFEGTATAFATRICDDADRSMDRATLLAPAPEKNLAYTLGTLRTEGARLTGR
jgi:hypothetical protein